MNSEKQNDTIVAAVIPSYRARSTILGVLERIDQHINRIYVVDDGCPENTGQLVQGQCPDSRVVVLFNEANLGVGGAVIRGFRQAMEDGADIIVKIDADDQMDPALAEKFIRPIEDGRADYTKGNRFYNLESLNGMPKLRLLGNAVLSFMSKASSGYWDIMDPTNGYIAIHSKVLKLLPLDKLSKRYFFESDILFRLATVRAVVVDIPMDSKYGNEKSNLSEVGSVGLFFGKHTVRFFKRIFYNYFLRDFNIASLQMLVGPALFVGGGIFGLDKWIENYRAGVETPSGTVMLAALPVLVGIQLVLSAINYDISNTPRKVIHDLL